MTLKFLLVLAVYSVTLGVVSDLVNTRVPDPYMDEIFHIPQAQRYCDGNFTQWDSKITTLPGLYIFSVGLLDPAFKISNFMISSEESVSVKLLDFCSVQYLRSINLLFSIINVVLIHTITSQLHGLKESYNDNLGLWSSVNMSLLPVLFMFSFLYYTDQVSTCMVLLTLCLQTSGQHWLAALSGVLAILCRQTNIIWVFLCGALTAGDILITEVRCHQAASKHPPTISLTASGQLWELCIGIMDLAKQPLKMLRLVGLVMVRCGGYIATGLGFLAFIHINNGIVVGDRSAHQATVHLTQLGYFAAFFTALTWPHAVKTLPDFLAFLRQHWLRVALLSAVIVTVIYYNTLAHPYLLADNRHFTFYIWQRLVMRHWAVKYLLSPVYIFGLYHIGQCLAKTDLILKLVLPVCVAINLVPQLLLEFRYFIIPYLLIRAQIKPVCWKSLALESLTMLSVNAVTIYMFLYTPFTWEHEPDQVQRFMW